MNKTQKILLGVGVGVVVLGGTVTALVMGQPTTTKTGKNGKGGSKKAPKRASEKLKDLPVWRETDRPRVEELARTGWQALGQPTWSKEQSLELARRVAIKMYPNATLTTSNTWPSTDAVSEQWITQGQQVDPEFVGAKAWTKIKFIVDSVMGYVPVT